MGYLFELFSNSYVMRRKSMNCIKALRYIFASVPVLFILSACDSGSDYVFQKFSYPPKSAPHLDDWEYVGEIRVYSTEMGSLSKLSEKEIVITIQDKVSKRLLKDTVRLEGFSIRSVITWEKFDSLIIDLYSVDTVNEKNWKNQLQEKKILPVWSRKYIYDEKLKEYLVSE